MYNITMFSNKKCPTCTIHLIKYIQGGFDIYVLQMNTKQKKMSNFVKTVMCSVLLLRVSNIIKINEMLRYPAILVRILNFVQIFFDKVYVRWEQYVLRHL